MSTPRTSEALAEHMRERPPRLDDLARARMERGIVQAIATPPRKRSVPRVALVAASLLAAAAALTLVLIREDDAAPIARFERRQASASVERGTLEEGSSIRTAAGEVAELQVVDSRVRIGGGSRVRIARLAQGRLALDLTEGTLDVAFHPRERGAERMTVQTPDARVEVVGTVFRVTASGGGTDVSVSDGTVRVVPREGVPRLVHAGESTRVVANREGQEAIPEVARPEPAQSERAQPDRAAPDEAAPEEAAPEEAAPEESAPEAVQAPPTPAERLERARRLIGAGRAAAANRVLRGLTRSSAPASVRAEAWMVTADVHLREGRLDAAAQAYEHAAREGRGTAGGAIAIFSLARLQHRRIADPAAARASYERYLAVAPNGALASQARRALCSLGDRARCEAP